MAGNRRIDPRENRSYEEPLLPPLHEVLGGPCNFASSWDITHTSPLVHLLDVLGKRIPHTEPPPQTEPPPHIKPPPHIPRHSPHDYRSEHGQNVSYRPVGIDVSTQPVQPHDRGWQRPLPSSGSIPPRPTQSSSSHPHASSSRPHASSSRSHASSSRLDASSLGPDASSLDPDASSSDSEPSHSYHVFNVTPDKGLVHQRSSRQDDFDGSRLRPRPSNSTDTVRKYACSECERRFAKPSTLKVSTY